MAKRNRNNRFSSFNKNDDTIKTEETPNVISEEDSTDLTDNNTISETTFGNVDFSTDSSSEDTDNNIGDSDYILFNSDDEDVYEHLPEITSENINDVKECIPKKKSEPVKKTVVDTNEVSKHKAIARPKLSEVKKDSIPHQTANNSTSKPKTREEVKQEILDRSKKPVEIKTYEKNTIVNRYQIVFCKNPTPLQFNKVTNQLRKINEFYEVDSVTGSIVGRSFSTNNSAISEKKRLAGKGLRPTIEIL